MKSIKLSLFFSLFITLSNITAQVITIDDTKTAQQLIENVLVNSTCANVSNISGSGDAFTPGQQSFAYFNANGSSFPLKEGIILSTSTSKNAIGPFVSDEGGGSSAWLGDSDLNQILGINSANATVLEFDFIPLTNFINFNYIFASNEYQFYFPCDFSDAFAFLIKEVGSTSGYKNIAVLPGTNTPVSSINIHPTIDPRPLTSSSVHPGCPAINENYFNGYNTSASPINYSGQVIKLNAQANVIIGTKYHIKLVIADDKEERYDSAIFLEAGSFATSIDLGTDRTSTSNNPICFGDTFIIDTKLPSNYTYEWFKNGSTTAISGETKPTLSINDGGTYKVKVTFAPSCSAEDEIKIEYTSPIILSNTSLSQCDDDGDGISVFDLTKVNEFIKNNDPNLINITYFKSLSDAQNQINPITTPTSYINSLPNEILFARVSNTYGCVNFAQLDLKISNNSISIQNPIEKCDDTDLQDGFTQFDLNALVTPQILNGLIPGLTVEYFLTESEAISQKNKLPNLFTNTIPNQQIIYARIVNGPDCFRIVPETLIIHTFDPPNFQDQLSFLCEGTSIDLTVDSSFSSYLWSNGSNTNTTNITTPGNYSVTVTNTEGCQKTKTFEVKTSGIATITNILVNDFSGQNNTVSVSFTGNGSYEFSIDGNFYQENPNFIGVKPGKYLATAKDKNGCGISTPYSFYVLDYPRFFTPNNDGYNDTWKIKNLEILPKSNLTIYDRYGKLLKQLNSLNSGWNGTYLEKELPADDYWFVLGFEDGKTIKGHFSLKR
jgi:gliding motility-associated-like protein